MEVPMIIKRLGLALFLVMGAAFIGALLVAPALAQEGLGKGSTVLSFQLAHGDGDFVTAEDGTGFITAYQNPEWGGQAQIQHFITANWALAASVGIGTFKETDEPGTNAPPATPDFEYSQSSFNVRVGFDRFAHISEGFHLYVGPGIQIWSGDQTRDFGVGPELESESVSRIGLNGRIGAHVGLREYLGFIGGTGALIAEASAEHAGAAASWPASGNHGALDIAFDFYPGDHRQPRLVHPRWAGRARLEAAPGACSRAVRRRRPRAPHPPARVRPVPGRAPPPGLGRARRPGAPGPAGGLLDPPRGRRPGDEPQVRATLRPARGCGGGSRPGIKALVRRHLAPVDCESGGVSCPSR